MQAGADLDRLVAIHVFGLVEGRDFGEWAEHDWQRDEDGQIDQFAYDGDTHNGPSCQRCYHSFCMWCEGGEDRLAENLARGPCRVAPEHYSQGIGLAWQVVDKLRALGWDVTVQVGYGAAYCTVEREHSYVSHQASDESTCTAICKAALAAVGVEVE